MPQEAPWRSRPVFISSTFRDMQAERDYLVSRVFPDLEEQLRAYRTHLEPIDLRVGVETQGRQRAGLAGDPEPAPLLDLKPPRHWGKGLRAARSTTTWSRAVRGTHSGNPGLCAVGAGGSSPRPARP